MKKIILSAAILSMSLAFAQEKEVKAASDAIAAKDMKTAQAQIAAAESKMNGNVAMLEPEYQEQYYFAKGALSLQSGNTNDAAMMIAKIAEMGKSKIYSGKNSNKEKVYFIGKAAADASGITGLKEESYQPKTLESIKQFVSPMLQAASKQAVDAYNAKNYQVAGGKFKEVYYLLKAIGQDNAQYLYNAAISYGLAKDMTNANQLFTELLDSGYTGVETTYTAKSKDGTVAPYEKSMWDLLKKDPTYTDFKTETSKSIESDIYEAAVRLQIEDGKYDQALVTLNKGLKKFPNNLFLLEQKGIVYSKTGKTSEYVENQKGVLANNPKDPVAWFNLGVMQSKDPALKEEAKTSYLKAIELNPSLKNVYENLTYLELGDDEKAIEDYKALKKEGKIEAANDVLKKRKERFAKSLPFAEKWYLESPDNVQAVSLLKSFYQNAGNDAKYKEFKAKEDAMKK